MSLVQGIVQNAPMLIASAVQAITAFLSGILQMLPVILQAGVQLILGLAQGIISNIPLILQSAVLLIQQFVTGLTQMLPTIIQGGIQLVIFSDTGNYFKPWHYRTSGRSNYRFAGYRFDTGYPYDYRGNSAVNFCYHRYNL